VRSVKCKSTRNAVSANPPKNLYFQVVISTNGYRRISRDVLDQNDADGASHGCRGQPIFDIRAGPYNSSCVQVGANQLSGTRAIVPAAGEAKLEASMTFKALALAGVTVVVSAIPSFAHHSFAMFDAEKKVTLDGTVKEFQWTNPHTWILLTVSNAQGKAEQWAIEMGGPSGLARQGWVPKTLTPGMKVQAVIHPLRDGTPGGQFMAVTLPDGTLLGNPNARAGANAGAGP
jgi:hypothetical protein